MADGYKVVFLGKETICYGELNDCSNFDVVCENEYDDDIWCEGLDAFTEANLSWENVVMLLQPHFHSDIVEITAV